jgi:hypothetical protein
MDLRRRSSIALWQAATRAPTALLPLFLASPIAALPFETVRNQVAAEALRSCEALARCLRPHPPEPVSEDAAGLVAPLLAAVTGRLAGQVRAAGTRRPEAPLRNR